MFWHNLVSLGLNDDLDMLKCHFRIFFFSISSELSIVYWTGASDLSYCLAVHHYARSLALNRSYNSILFKKKKKRII